MGESLSVHLVFFWKDGRIPSESFLSSTVLFFFRPVVTSQPWNAFFGKKFWCANFSFNLLLSPPHSAGWTAKAWRMEHLHWKQSNHDGALAVFNHDKILPYLKKHSWQKCRNCKKCMFVFFIIIRKRCETPKITLLCSCWSRWWCFKHIYFQALGTFFFSIGIRVGFRNPVIIFACAYGCFQK